MEIELLESFFQVRHINFSTLTSLLVHNGEKSVITGYENGDICWHALNAKEQFWKPLFSVRAHKTKVNYLCQLTRNHIVSASNDCSDNLKVWEFNNQGLKLIKILKRHTKPVNKVICFESNSNLFSCSDDFSVVFWKYKQIPNIEPKVVINKSGQVKSILKLKINKHVLVVSSLTSGLTFYDLPSFKLINKKINGIFPNPNGLLELFDGKIAAIQNNPARIVIINYDKCAIIKEIRHKYITSNISCLQDYLNQSFIFTSIGRFMQISNSDKNDYNVIYIQQFQSTNLFGNAGLFVIKDGNLIVTNNGENGINFLKVANSETAVKIKLRQENQKLEVLNQKNKPIEQRGLHQPQPKNKNIYQQNSIKNEYQKKLKEQEEEGLIQQLLQTGSELDSYNNYSEIYDQFEKEVDDLYNDDNSEINSMGNEDVSEYMYDKNNDSINEYLRNSENQYLPFDYQKLSQLKSSIKPKSSWMSYRDSKIVNSIELNNEIY